MKPPEYSEQEIQDIKEREQKCLEFLKENQITPSCAPMLVNMGDDTFGIKLIPFLKDFKYNKSPSPIQKDDLLLS